MDRSEQLRGIQWIKFRNDAGSTAPAGGILRVTGYNNDAEEPFLTIDQPNTFGAQYNHAINDDLDVASGEYGYCCLGQVVPALYDSADGTPAFGELWGPRASTWKLRKNTGGFRIMSEGYVVDNSRFRALVAPVPFTRFRGTLDADLAKGFSGNVSVSYLSSGAYSDTGVNLSAFNGLTDLTTSTVVYCEIEANGASNRWRIYAWEC